MYIYYVCGNLNPLEPFRRLHGHVPICGAGTTSATTCNTVAGAWSRFASSFICCSLLHAMATKAVTFTKSGEEAVKLKRPRIRRPFCIVSDEMLALPLLPWWARSSANNSAISTSSSRRDVGRRQQGLELKTPGSSNWARAVFASARVFGLWFKLQRHRDSEHQACYAFTFSLTHKIREIMLFIGNPKGRSRMITHKIIYSHKFAHFVSPHMYTCKWKLCTYICIHTCLAHMQADL